MRCFCCCCCFYRQTSNYFVFAWIFIFYLARSFSTSTCSAFVLLPFFVTIRTCFTHKKSDTFGVCVCTAYDTPFICVLLFFNSFLAKIYTRPNSIGIIILMNNLLCVCFLWPIVMTVKWTYLIKLFDK